MNLKRYALLLFLLVNLLTSSLSARVAWAAKLPNVLILYADDLGYGDLSCQNPDSKIPTPHLDQLAREGVRFTDGHSSSGICTPSRYALLTGRYHWRKFHKIVGSFGDSVFAADRLTLPEMLQEHGYHTAVIGKWHLGWDWDSIRKPEAKPTRQGKHKVVWAAGDFDWSRPIAGGPLAHGFDHYFGDAVINFPPYCWIEDDRVTRVPDAMMDSSQWKGISEGSWEFRPGPMVSDWNPYENLPTTAKRGVEFIHNQSQQDRPFLLYFSFPSPHAPIIPGKPFIGKSKAGAYGDYVYETDDVCGRLLQALEESGQAENTLVVFTADNGPERYAYKRQTEYDHWSSAPCRGVKRDIYEGGHRVPFLVRWPGVTQPDKVSPALISQVDLMATLAAIVGHDLAEDQAEDSHNLLPLLKGDTDSVRTTHIHNTYEKTYAIRHNDWVLINAKNGYRSGGYAKWEQANGYAADDDQPTELYNMSNDLSQRHNVASDYPEVVQELQSLLKRIRKQGHSAPRFSER